jgi:hypothetical protein
MARAVERRRPPAKGFAVPDMSVGSPGTEVDGVEDDTYEIVLFGTAGQKVFGTKGPGGAFDSGVA